MSGQLKMNEVFGDKIHSMNESHLACVLLLDTSASMGDDGKLERLEEGIKRFKANVVLDEIAKRTVDVALVTFDSTVKVVKHRTDMYQSLGTPCHKPWIIMITDGASTSSDQEMREVAERIHKAEAQDSHGRLSFWVVGIDNYDPEEVFKLTNRVLELRDVDFTGIFDWFSESMACISRSHVGEQIEFTKLPENARKAEKDRTIDSDWY